MNSGAIKYSLWQEGADVKFQIHWMNEAYRIPSSVTTSNGFVVESCDSIELQGDHIFLWGSDRAYDTDIAIASCGNVITASKYIMDIHIALRDWVEDRGRNIGRGLVKSIECEQFIYQL